MVCCLLSNVCVATSFYQRSANHVSFCFSSILIRIVRFDPLFCQIQVDLMVEVDGILHRIISDAVAHELPRRLATSAARQQGLNIQHPEVVREEIARRKILTVCGNVRIDILLSSITLLNASRIL